MGRCTKRCVDEQAGRWITTGQHAGNGSGQTHNGRGCYQVFCGTETQVGLRPEDLDWNVSSWLLGSPRGYPRRGAPVALVSVCLLFLFVRAWCVGLCVCVCVWCV